MPGDLTYGAYLHLDDVLGAQHPRTRAHDEVLFIIQHQATELWFKLVLHELRAAEECIDSGELRPAFKNLARVSRIMRVLIDSWEVLSTMTPSDYTTFRSSLESSSGFQSWQFRELEFTLGNRDRIYLATFRQQPEVLARLEAVLASPSIYDRSLRQLAARGFPIADRVLVRDLASPYASDPTVLAAWREIYRDAARWWDLYELAEELVDLEDAMRQWRFRHVTTVERVIGGKPGTGGTSGVGYLRERLDVVLFPELWEVRTEL